MKTITRLLFSLKVVFQRECVNVVLSLPGQLGRWGEKRETCLSGVSSRHPSCPSWCGRPSTVRSLLTSQPRTLTGALRWIRITSEREKYLGFLPSQDNFLVFLFSQLTSEILIQNSRYSGSPSRAPQSQSPQRRRRPRCLWRVCPTADASETPVHFSLSGRERRCE